MGVRFSNKGEIEDLNFTITLTGKCNLFCEYCPLLHTNKDITIEQLDRYIDFFVRNEAQLKQYAKNIVFVFFGGEPLLQFDKISYFIQKMYSYGINTKFVVYTNGVFLSQDILDILMKYPGYQQRITFYVSIDGDLVSMLKYRLKNSSQFDKIIRGIGILQKNDFPFSISKVLYEKEAEELYRNFCFLDSLCPIKLDFLPVASFYEGGYTKEHIKEVIKGIDMFIHKLLLEKYSELQIMEYFGLPDDLESFKKLYKSDCGLYGDLDGEVYSIIDRLSIFSLKDSFSEEEKKDMYLGNIKDNSLLETIKNYKNFEDKTFQLGISWHERKFPNELSAFSLFGVYFVKKLLIFKFKPQYLNGAKKL